MPSKVIFRILNRIHIFLYRRSNGRILGKIVGSPVLLLTTTGRKTGKARTVPIVYCFDNGQYAVIATDKPAWHNNLKNTAKASIEVKGELYWVTSRDAHGDEEKRLWTRIIEQSPAFKAAEEQANHQLVVLEPLSA